MIPQNFKKLTPILIYGPRKGGTTLLQNLHDTRNQVLSCPSEVKLKQLIYAKWTGNPTDDLKTYLDNNKVIEVPNFNLVQYKNDLLEDHIGIENGLSDLIINDMYCLFKNIEPDFRPKNLTHFAVKEVGGKTDDIIRNWKLMFPHGKIIMLVRDPLMVASSILRERRRRGLKQSSGKLLNQIHSGFKTLEDQLKYQHDPNVHFLKYENLIEHTEVEMRKICDFIGIEFDEMLTKITIFGENVISSTASKKSKVIFKSTNRWFDNLTFKEKLLVVAGLIQLKFKKIRNKSKMNYSKTFYSSLPF